MAEVCIGLQRREWEPLKSRSLILWYCLFNNERLYDIFIHSWFYVSVLEFSAVKAQLSLIVMVSVRRWGNHQQIWSWQLFSLEFDVMVFEQTQVLNASSAVQNQSKWKYICIFPRVVLVKLTDFWMKTRLYKILRAQHFILPEGFFLDYFYLFFCVFWCYEPLSCPYGCGLSWKRN